ncbi:MAG: hypothetical protein IPM97_00095 [Bdellovibrionaceae bacterium]|nr:hypothetical protein [Pseudobdellovibrionaceae bacterium]
MKKTSVALLIFSFALAIQALGQARLPLIKLDSIQLNDAFKSSLQKSLITEGPGLVLVVDSQSLTVAAFVSGEPERMDPSSYFFG